MKKIFITLIIGFFIGAVALFIVNSKWPVNELFDSESTSENVTVTTNSFSKVTSKLDKGGDLYLYLNTDRINKALKNLVENLRSAAKGSSLNKESSAKIDSGFDLIQKILKETGLQEISGLGISSIALDEDMSRTRFILHHHKDNKDGLIWNLPESKPHPIRFLSMMDENSVIAFSSDIRPGYMWEWIKSIASDSGIPDFKKSIESLEPSLKKNGVDLKKILGSIEGESGIIIGLDKKDMKKIPAGGKTIQVPDPSLALVLHVKDNSIFDLLKKMVPGGKYTEEKGLKKIAVQAPPMPVTLEPAIIQKEGLLILASNGKIVDGIFKALKGESNVTGTEDFKKLSQDMPEKGNGMTYISSEFFKAITGIQKQIFDGMKDKKIEGMDIIKKMGKSLEKISLYRITENTENGFIITSNSTLKPETLLLFPALTAGGIVSAIAIPNLMQATSKSKQKATMSDIRMLNVAIASYIVDSGVAPVAADIDELSKKLTPFYIKKFPFKDGWGNKFLYKHGTGDKGSFYSIASPGKDGIFEGWEQSGYYKVFNKNDFNRDIILSNGKFVYYPDKK
ncbi:MAG: type II secretion system protein GspG [Acidobacteriota bacterium]